MSITDLIAREQIATVVCDPGPCGELCEVCLDEADRLIAAVEKALADAGYVVVPAEPTEARTTRTHEPIIQASPPYDVLFKGSAP